ncbi:class I SAM-dependent methyltransferase [Frigidibacter sp. RF13]|uniref:class I SAM-dependent methyltransferase n=1 Tax=Frigidibacter sp. RF13 TaxID=2997340 RepID=UPI002271F0BE|nr:class I SAM-dependent methyltransferase [Frigidibacter sp. RF13]MCY1127735.1 class I SAM-dependent methyltransferase [Frigidibacter sp. RF13]
MSGGAAPRRARARAALLAQLPAGSVGAEIGVWQGDFSAQILERVRPALLFLVDPWRFRPDRWMPTFGTGMLVNSRAEVLAAGGPQRHLDRLHDQVVGRFAARSDVVIVRAPGAAFFARCRAQSLSLDWVYVDGDHSYEGALADIAGAWETVRPGGLITGDDLGFSDLAEGGRKTVKAAVGDFLAIRPKARSAFFREGGQWGFVRTDEP